MKPFSDFYRFITPYAPGVASPSMDSALRNAAVEFCERTRVWQEYGPATSVTADVGTYDVDAPFGAEPVKIMSMAYDGRPLSPKTVDELDMQYADWQSDTGTPGMFTQILPTEFMLVPVPAQDGVDLLKYRAAYKPSITADTLPDILLAQYARDMAHGALAQLLLEADAPYTNPSMAAAYATMFENKIQEVNIHVAKALGRAPIRARGSFY